MVFSACISTKDAFVKNVPNELAYMKIFLECSWNELLQELMAKDAPMPWEGVTADSKFSSYYWRGPEAERLGSLHLILV